MYMYFLCIYKKPIILSLFKIVTLNFTMYIFTILTCTLNIYVIVLQKFNFNKHFFTIKDIQFLTNGTAENKQITKAFYNSVFFKSNFSEHFLCNKGLQFSFIIVKRHPKTRKSQNKIIILNTRKFRCRFYIPHILSI